MHQISSTSFLLAMTFLITVLTTPLNAQSRHQQPLQPGPSKPNQSGTEERLNNLEARLNQTEYQLNVALNKIDGIEHFLRTINPAPPPPPVYNLKISCMLVDTGYSKTFLASGRNRLEAEIEVKTACGKIVNAAYCDGKLKCDDKQNSPPYARGFICLVVDSG